MRQLLLNVIVLFQILDDLGTTLEAFLFHRIPSTTLVNDSVLHSEVNNLTGQVNSNTVSRKIHIIGVCGEHAWASGLIDKPCDISAYRPFKQQVTIGDNSLDGVL